MAEVIRVALADDHTLLRKGLRALLNNEPDIEVIAEVADGAEAEIEPRPAFSEREQKVLRLTAEGFSNHEIGQQLFISPKTVDTYWQRIMEKLGLHHRSESVGDALNRGLLKADDPSPATAT
jgi:DNA-binding NarL/FixJ family response regulator